MMRERKTFYQRVGKRLLDLALTIPALILLLPVFLIVAALVRWRLGSPIFFCQHRPGLGGRVFTMIKFRSMTDARDAAGKLLPDHKRLTPLGIFLRTTSLDELPELFNVLRGDMSLVGPRPLLLHYVDRYTPEQRRRHDVRPGVTGWAQIHGRNAVPWDERFRLDVLYVDKHSFWFDLQILFQTIWTVLSRKGILIGENPAGPRKTPTGATQTDGQASTSALLEASLK